MWVEESVDRAPGVVLEFVPPLEEQHVQDDDVDDAPVTEYVAVPVDSPGPATPSPSPAPAPRWDVPGRQPSPTSDARSPGSSPPVLRVWSPAKPVPQLRDEEVKEVEEE